MRIERRDVVEYEVRKFRLGLDGDETEYQGKPSPELDRRWNGLYEMGINLITKDMAARLPNKTILFPHDKQRRYLVELDVFHQLHCLNMVRKALHPEYYEPHTPGLHTGDEDELLGPHHIEHCIDAIRQSLMCSADISSLTWSWDEDRHRHMERGTVLHTYPQRCCSARREQYSPPRQDEAVLDRVLAYRIAEQGTRTIPNLSE
ncbi:hypothetical protein SPBR_09083 [Sporothrix brasiliensis 5110]|uniref:Tat pathway signal sequence n=1 Tax=Sporothrix brasiliensis 5110 TaxID=1398154 RepID=A0A0C2FLM7_9PEZI|nr:uncharacterized protein SPBR_09083 [Sporothrix brasiliensis 5110]KIH91993.1 hypothetical protein SPBR_09083 [Sporothrix brasiliensis 5110]